VPNRRGNWEICAMKSVILALVFAVSGIFGFTAVT
jgi:hypothetical protein